jgi:hypothetical protein
MPFVVSFQKIDPNLGTIIISAELTQSDANSIGFNQSYVDADMAGVDAIDLGAEPWTSLDTWQGVGAKIYSVDPLYTSAMLLFFLIFFSRLRSPAPPPPPPCRAASVPRHAPSSAPTLPPATLTPSGHVVVRPRLTPSAPGPLRRRTPSLRY